MTGKAYSPAAGRQAASCSQSVRSKSQIAHLGRTAEPALSADARQAQVAASLGQIRERRASLVSARYQQGRHAAAQQIGRDDSGANRSTEALQRVKAGQATQQSASTAQLKLLRQAAEVRSFVTSSSRLARPQSAPSTRGGSGSRGGARGPSAEALHEHLTLPDTPAPAVRFVQQEAESWREEKERGSEEADEGTGEEEEGEARHLTLDALSAEALIKMARHYGTDWSGCVGKRDLVVLLCRPGALPQDFWFEVQEAGRRAQELYAKAAPLAQQACRAAGGSRGGCGGGRGGGSGGGDGGSGSGGSASGSKSGRLAPVVLQGVNCLGLPRPHGELFVSPSPAQAAPPAAPVEPTRRGRQQRALIGTNCVSWRPEYANGGSGSGASRHPAALGADDEVRLGTQGGARCGTRSGLEKAGFRLACTVL